MPLSFLNWIWNKTEKRNKPFSQNSSKWKHVVYKKRHERFVKFVLTLKNAETTEPSGAVFQLMGQLNFRAKKTNWGIR